MATVTWGSFLYHRVALLALLVSLGIGVLFAHTIWTMRQEQWDYHQHTNTNLSSTVAKGMQWALDGVDNGLQKAVTALQDAQALEGADVTHDAHQSLLVAMWRDINSSHFLVLDRQGQALNAPQDVHVMGKQFLAADFFQAFASQGQQGVFIAYPTQDLLMGEYVLPIARAVHDSNGMLVGVVVGVLRMREINAWLSRMNLGKHSGLNVIREDGLVITRFPYDESIVRPTLAGSSNLARFVSTAQGSFVGTAVLDGVERLYTHNRVGHYPMVVNVAQSTQTILSSWQRGAWQLAMFAALLMLGCLGLAVMFVLELSRRERTEGALFEEKERLRLTLKSISDAVVCVDAQGLITYMNPIGRQILGLEMQELLHKPVEFLHVLPAMVGDENSLSPLRHALNTGVAAQRLRIRVLDSASGHPLEMEESVSLVKALDGSILGAVAVLRDVSAAAAQEARMQKLAFHDALTGLPNRLLLQDRAQQAMAQCKRTGEKMAVMYLDLDGFKQINDRWGHQAGDAAIVHAAKGLQACVRESDTVCRLGGDEFVLLLPTCSEVENLHTIVDKIQQASAWPFVWQGHECVLHFSGGIAVFPDHAMHWDALLHCADSAMYAAKQAGRDRIYFHPCEPAAALYAAAAEPVA